MKAARAHHAAGRLDEAERAYARCLQIEPREAEASYGLGSIAGARGEPGKAVPHFVAALRAAEDKPHHWVALASVLLATDRLTEARAILERFLAKGFPTRVVRDLAAPVIETLHTNAAALFALGDLTKAETLLETLLLLDENHTAAVRLAGVIADRAGRHDQAVHLLTLATTRDDSDGQAFADLGAALRSLGHKDAAAEAFAKALIRAPGLFEAHIALADLHRQCGRLQDSLAHLSEALRLNPENPELLNNLAVNLHQLGRANEAMDTLERLSRTAPHFPWALSNLAHMQLSLPDALGETYLRTVNAFGERHADPLRRLRPFPNTPIRERPLKIGLISGDLHAHPVARFLEPFLEHRERAHYLVTAYSNGQQVDAISERIESSVNVWRSIVGLSDDAVADLVEADSIDILVDLSGHSGGHRLLVFGRKPAPIQVTWIGMPTATGLSAIDYRLTDAVFDPPGTDHPLLKETLWRLPGVSYCYRAQDDSPDVAARPPCLSNGYVTFGSLNKIEKVGDATLSAWRQLLAIVPDARLVLIVADFGNQQTRDRLNARLRDAGLPLERIELQARLPVSGNSLYGQIDIALDPFPFNGGTTSFDTLYMGVPFVALRGDHTVARMGAAILERIGLPQLIAANSEEYIAIAARLASSEAELVSIRCGLRDRLLNSPHMDHTRHAADVGNAFRSMWHIWCDDQGRNKDE